MLSSLFMRAHSLLDYGPILAVGTTPEAWITRNHPVSRRIPQMHRHLASRLSSPSIRRSVRRTVCRWINPRMSSMDSCVSGGQSEN